ncbi:MAG: MMPL family transporter [Acidobacteria bacterium]|nr:MMPL family transporter [Acidobacteriota bacterium]
MPRKAPKPLRETGWYRFSRIIQARPWTMAISCTVLLLMLALPVLGLRLGFSDDGNAPTSEDRRSAYDLLSDGFGPGFNGTLVATVSIGDPDDVEAVEALVETLDQAEGVSQAVGPNFDDPVAPEAAIIRLVADSAPQAAETSNTIERLRSEVIPAAIDGTSLEVYLTGFTAASIDFSEYLAGRTLMFFAIVFALSFLLLMVVFRSLLVPLKAVVMNALSIAAAYGLVVVVFQWGWFDSVLDTGRNAPIEPFIPMMMFAVVFGLSMDYEVFLLSRIKEEYDRSGDAVESVADGLAMTARVITAAAAIMVVVFGSFMFESDRVIRLFGFGLAVAVLIDATIVRMVLVPATMELLGERNWWIPGWLDRILPNIQIDGTPKPDPRGDDGPGQPTRDSERDLASH